MSGPVRPAALFDGLSARHAGARSAVVAPRLHQLDWGGVRLSIGVHDRVRETARDLLRIMINLLVDDIQAVHARLAAGGVIFSRPPEREDWGGWVASFADPDGNTLQLLQLAP